jgi:hypothetical protein
MVSGGATASCTDKGVIAAGDATWGVAVWVTLEGTVAAASASNPKKLIWSVLFIGLD